ncbi:MAG: hypothetical protein J6H20_06355, partial [Pyramidobacter sp.]|nr:hypothetical protein [Pyramidobacter sp.]
MKVRHLLAALCLLLAVVMPAGARPRFSRSHPSIGVVFATGSDDSMYTSAKAGITRAQSDLRVRLTSYLAGYDPSKYEQ